MSDNKHLSKNEIDFMNRYATELSEKIKSNNLKNEIRAWFRTEIYDKISNWKISRIYRTHYYSQSFYDQFIFETNCGLYGYIRHAAGLLTLFTSDREYEIKLGLGDHYPERVGIFLPMNKKQISGVELSDIVKILHWELLPDATEFWA
jgi:hypothetical protein